MDPGIVCERLIKVYDKGGMTEERDEARKLYDSIEEEFGSLHSVEDKKVSITSNKIGRNEPCPCGSGKKYKKCCGQETG